MIGKDQLWFKRGSGKERPVTINNNITIIIIIIIIICILNSEGLRMHTRFSQLLTCINE
jgi:hypothetical protein